MNFHTLLRRSALLLAGLGPVLAGCESDIDKYYEEVGGQFPTFLANSFGTATKYAAGETFTFEVQFAQQTAPVREIRIIQRIESNPDSTVVQTIPYRAAYSRLKRADTLVVSYTVPAAANKTRVRVHAQVVADNGQTKARTIAFRIAEPTPTISIAGSSNVTAPGTSTPVPADVVRYSLLLNQNGITTYPERPELPPASTAILYKDLDSLITYVRVGSTAERRLLRQRLPASGAQSGAQTTVNVDVPTPAGSSGQPVTYRFEVKTRFAGTPNFRATSATATAFTPGTPTSLAAPRTVSLTYTGTTGGDLAAYNLTTFAAVPASGAAADKDVAITSTASNAVRLQALNTTKFVRLTSGGAAAYTAATLNSIRQAYLTAAAANQVTQLDNVVPGDVVIARLRGADQYAIFTVTAVNRTAAAVVVTMDVKAL
ncbi:hypothetical protein LJ737_09865 [Hymenobacter sp. 15J16-1T3B]|uniref:hypothetical protein n=1 Tax=Hymenobacter sp. 15J16-1T3B TaxID=2886941 RepID=UPI001D12C576|nr:hypothetical protein [Hymenobacter sp. 15J16-1T3B]MCC3157546.1 hypothetical protein [Hymenobacter sp. 15J16-1T3B]